MLWSATASTGDLINTNYLCAWQVKLFLIFQKVEIGVQSSWEFSSGRAQSILQYQSPCIHISLLHAPVWAVPGDRGLDHMTLLKLLLFIQRRKVAGKVGPSS